MQGGEGCIELRKGIQRGAERGEIMGEEARFRWGVQVCVQVSKGLGMARGAKVSATECTKSEGNREEGEGGGQKCAVGQRG